MYRPQALLKGLNGLKGMCLTVGYETRKSDLLQGLQDMSKRGSLQHMQKEGPGWPLHRAISSSHRNGSKQCSKYRYTSNECALMLQCGKSA